jgi:cytochrome c-type biogenesis protein CcmH
MLLYAPFAHAQETQVEIPLQDQAQEQRARDLFRELRCEVCAGQSIADSNAPLAQDMRITVRNKVASGDTPEEVLDFFAQRYGESILMRPPLSASTAPLWLAPLFVALLGAWFIMRYFSRKKNTHF